LSLETAQFTCLVIIFQFAREIILSSKIYQYCLNAIYKTQSIKDHSYNSQNYESYPSKVAGI
jgi:hypothetical protein